jgi:hypothetical protein
LEIADAEQYRVVMEAALARCSSQPVNLMIVPDVADWAKAVGCANFKGDPIATSATSSAGGWTVIVRRSIDESRTYSVLAGINVRGRHKAHMLLSTPELFLRHLVLHELAHLENDWGQERENECDDWAFERLQDKVLGARQI